MREIYLANIATTRISKEALEKYIEVSISVYGTPSSLHGLGLAADKELKNARETILGTLSAKNSSVIFTSSGTEANNLAILGRALSKERYKRGAKIITTDSEHASVLSPTSHLKSMGFNVVSIPTVGGKIDTGALKREMTPDVILLSIMMVNNETGALYDTLEASKIMRENAKDALLHIDATQSYMKVRFTKQSVGADMITISSHKIEGPKGVGALIVDNRIFKSQGLSPIVFGGGQEAGLRSGTENVPAIAAFGVAAQAAFENLDSNIKKLSLLRNYLIEKLGSTPPLSSVKYTNPESYAPHILNITLPSIKSETMLHYLSSLGIYVSSGSACSSNSKKTVSSALTAYGMNQSEADSSIRISFSHRNEISDIDALCDGLASGISRLARIK